ncbi:ANTH-domain-containing protein [Ascoidea rubescens DSM 1968]|uniref:ANTH-domain-containing protein n=1 Tax=Ascoidea rubescens DSM 1968 TaxID=1344418 RepID=A0A1D2V8G7_9ASCO|nr:ANTH-domain-containing protein [Ascoidea rubescens DSM 1968]ODV57942.1 ANTH-domain-containing protein [Ascoidea rubescens DSM 1968]
MTTYEKIVKGATKIKIAAPKPKYIEPILLSTSNNEDFRTVLRILSIRLQDSSWPIVFKSLIVLHIMIREGELNKTLNFLSKNIKIFKVYQINEYNNQYITGNNDYNVKNLRKYSNYLITRSKQFQLTRIDYVRDERLNNNTLHNNPNVGGRLRNLSIEKGILSEVESVEKQIDSLLKCTFKEFEISSNEILLTSFKLLVNDLLSLYQSLNEGVINLLEHYFEMNFNNAKRALKIYKIFVNQTNDVVSYLRIAKHLENLTKLHVPTIRHAPTALANSLEDYLNDKDFEINRRQYLLEKENKQRDKNKNNDNYNNQTNSKKNEKTWIKKDSSKLNSNSVSKDVNVNDKIKSTNENDTNELIVQQTGYNPWALALQGQNHNLNQNLQILVPVQFPIQQFQQLPILPIQTGNPFINSTPLPGINPSQSLNQISQAPFSNPASLQMQQMQQMQNSINNQFANQQSLSNLTGSVLTAKSSELNLDKTINQDGLPKHKTGNPFSLDSIENSNLQPTNNTVKRSKTNPFASFSNSSDSDKYKPIENNSNKVLISQITGTNPFSSFNGEKPNNDLNSNNGISSLSGISTPFDDINTGAQSSTNFFNNNIKLTPQFTFGGLENLNTVPVFDQTRQQAQIDYIKTQRTGNMIQYMQQQQQQQQQTQIQIQPQVASIGNTMLNNNLMSFQPLEMQQQPLHSQQFQQTAVYNNNVPSLI